jgi:hypothetical protein
VAFLEFGFSLICSSLKLLILMQLKEAGDAIIRKNPPIKQHNQAKK